jgi:hypothetical protein
MTRPDYSQLEETLRHCVDRGASLEERGTETNSFNAVLGVRLGTRIFLRRFIPRTQFAGCSEVEAHCLALEGRPSIASRRE